MRNKQNFLFKENLHQVFAPFVPKYVSKTKHPDWDLWVYNYTQATQFEGLWNDVTTLARGIIVDGDGNCVARPFPKFFNLSEYKEKLPNELFVVTEKMDGSLGILYQTPDGRYAIATRGSFASEQAIWATEWFRRMGYDKLPWDAEYTYLFEIIYPENRIVVDYGRQRRLVLLAAIYKADGMDLDVAYVDYPDKVVTRDDVEMVEDLATLQEQNAEGFVVLFQNGLRLKVKMEEYVRLHRLVTGLTKRRVWDLMRNGQTAELDELEATMPEEFTEWLQNAREELAGAYAGVYARAVGDFWHILGGVTNGRLDIDEQFARKEFARMVQDHPYKGLLFARMDGKSLDQQIWQIIKPAHEPAFWGGKDDE